MCLNVSRTFVIEGWRTNNVINQSSLIKRYTYIYKYIYLYISLFRQRTFLSSYIPKYSKKSNKSLKSPRNNVYKV